MIKVISGFPGIGKSYAAKNLTHLKILDSDSSSFSWIPDPNDMNEGRKCDRTEVPESSNLDQI